MKKDIAVTVRENVPVAENIYKMTLFSEELPKDIGAGQFLNLSVGDSSHLLRRPLGIMAHTQNTVTVCYQVKGEGTQMLAQKEAGDQLTCLLPLGNGFVLDESAKKVAVIGGGVGIFPLISVLNAYRGQKNFVSYIGFRNLAATCMLDELSACDKLTISTDDGSYGKKGNAVQAFLADYETEMPDEIIACGPPVMLRVLKAELSARKIDTHCLVSLEERMGCGIGACLVCVCKTTDGKNARVCKNGPVFDIREVEL